MNDYTDFKIVHEICQFHEVYQRWPFYEEVVGFEFADRCLCDQRRPMLDLSGRLTNLMQIGKIHLVGRIFCVPERPYKNRSVSRLAWQSAALRKRLAIAEAIVYNNPNREDQASIERMKYQLSRIEQEIIQEVEAQFS